MVEGDNDLNLHIDPEKLKKLQKELTIQADTAASQLAMLEQKLIEATLSIRSKDKESSRVKQIEEISKAMTRLHETIDPLNKKKALVDALLDPPTMFWLELRIGDHSQMVERALEDIIGGETDKEEQSEPEGKTEVKEHEPKSAGSPQAAAQGEEAEVSDQADEEKTKKKQSKHRPWRKPGSDGGFGDFLEE